MSDGKQNDYQRAGIAYSPTETKSEDDSLAQIRKLENRFDYLLSVMECGFNVQQLKYGHQAVWHKLWGRDA